MPKTSDKPETKSSSRKKQSDKVDEALKETFPASDPPAWTSSHVGKPVRKKKPQK